MYAVGEKIAVFIKVILKRCREAVQIHVIIVCISGNKVKLGVAINLNDPAQSYLTRMCYLSQAGPIVLLEVLHQAISHHWITRKFIYIFKEPMVVLLPVSYQDLISVIHLNISPENKVVSFLMQFVFGETKFPKDFSFSGPMSESSKSFDKPQDDSPVNYFLITSEIVLTRLERGFDDS